MISKEEYKKTLIRMWDSVRDEDFKGVNFCHGVRCSIDCPIKSFCGKKAIDYYDMIEFVEKWGKEHPIETNGDKFKEVFGFEIEKTFNGCAGLPCPSHCTTCPNKGFWDKEYKGVEV